MLENTVTRHAVRLCFAFIMASGVHLPTLASDMVSLSFATSSSGGPGHVRLIISDTEVVTLDAQDRMQSLYRVMDEELLIIDRQQGTVTRLNQDTVRKVAAELNQRLSSLLASIESLPADQRDKSLAGFNRLFNTEAHQPETVATALMPTGKRGAFAGIPCQWHKYSVQDSVARACLAETSALPGGKQLLAMLETLSQFYDSLYSGQNPRLTLPIPNNPLAPLAKLGRVAIKIVESDADGLPMLDVELLAVDRGAVDQALFELPEGLEFR